jgi:chorismate--pyruvate lyase
MIQIPARRLECTHWLPAERLGQFNIDPAVRPWLIAKGLITLRMHVACGERFSLMLIEQRTGLLGAAVQAALRVTDSAGLFREVELACDDQVWVFVQTIVPDSTLCLHPWLAELGDASLGLTLNELSAVERSAYEYAWLSGDEPLTARALRAAELKPAGLWARRSRVQLRGAPLLVQEVFLPALGRL